jgi:hypothetical protein
MQTFGTFCDDRHPLLWSPIIARHPHHPLFNLRLRLLFAFLLPLLATARIGSGWSVLAPIQQNSVDCVSRLTLGSLYVGKLERQDVNPLFTRCPTDKFEKAKSRLVLRYRLLSYELLHTPNRMAMHQRNSNWNYERKTDPFSG